MGEEKSHADEFINEWPGVNENAVDGDQDQAHTFTAQGGGGENLTDSKGQTFDENEHLTDKETGKPKYNKNGTFKKRPKRGGKEKLNLDNTKEQQQQQISEDQIRQMGAQQAAEVCVNMQVLMGVYMGGESWKPGKDTFGNNEYESGVQAYRDCFLAYEVTYLPPWMAPCIWTMGFFGRRIMQDKQAQSKISLFWSWLKGKFSRKKSKKVAENARDDNRDN